MSKSPNLFCQFSVLGALLSFWINGVSPVLRGIIKSGRFDTDSLFNLLDNTAVFF